MNTSKLADWSEILASIAVVASVLFLLQEVRANTRAVERDAAFTHAAALAEPFFQEPGMRSALEKVRLVDGANPTHAAMIERYGFTFEEAVLWDRHMVQLWAGIEANYNYGDRDAAAAMVEMVVTNYPDNQLFAKNVEFAGEFGALVRRLSDR